MKDRRFLRSNDVLTTVRPVRVRSPARRDWHHRDVRMTSPAEAGIA